MNSGINTANELIAYQTDNAGVFINILDSNLNAFNDYSINALTTMFDNLFNILGMNKHAVFGALFGYMLSIQMYHLLFDLLVFFIHLIHSYADSERWCK